LALTLALGSGPASAYSVVAPGGGDATFVGTSNDQSGGPTGGEATLIGNWNAANDPDVSLLYKQNIGEAEDTDSLAGYYTTLFSESISGDGADGATITWAGAGNHFACPACLLVVKDGNNEPAVYLFNLVGWNGMDTLTLSGFWTGTQGSISHVSLYGSGITTSSSGGTPGSGTVPEPASSSLALLGLGLLAVGFRARNKGKRG
jgi:hypothetical protein